MIKNDLIKYLSIALTSLFGFAAFICVLLISVNFENKEKRKYPCLQKIEGRKIQLFVAAIIFSLIAYASTVMKDFLTSMPPQPPPPDGNRQEPPVANPTPIITPMEPTNIFTPQNGNVNGSANQLNQNINANANITTKPKQPGTTVDSVRSNKIAGHLSRAREFFSNAKYKEAISECDKVLELAPGHKKAIQIKNMAEKNLRVLPK